MQGVVYTPPTLARELAEALLRDASPREVLRVLDPCCGEGALLEAVAHLCMERGDLRLELDGLEIDPLAVDRAARRLSRVTEARPDWMIRIRRCDALDPREAWPESTHILANPPWVSFSGRGAAALPTATANTYRAAWSSFAGWPSLHGAFAERIARHIGAEGTHAQLLLPASICHLDGYCATRAAITAVARLVAPPRALGEKAFGGVVEPAVLLALAPRRDSMGPAAGSWSDVGPARSWSEVETGEEELIRALQASPRLPHGSFRDFGVHTGNAAHELLRGEPGPATAPLRVGKDLHAYSLSSPRLHLRTDLTPREGGRRFRIGPMEAYRSFPVLLRQTANRPVAALHVEPTYFRNSLLACRPPSALDPAFAVAVLNGPVARAWHHACFADSRQRTFPQVKIAHLASQPFPLLRRGDAPALHDEVVRRVRELPQDPAPAALAEIDALIVEAFRLSQPLAQRILATRRDQAAAPKRILPPNVRMERPEGPTCKGPAPT